MSRTTFPRLAEKEEVALRLLLASGEMFGLDMVKANVGLKRGTVYVVLSRLEDRGFITSHTTEPVEGQRGPGRRWYRLTGTGERIAKAIEAYLQGGELHGGVV